MIHSEIRRWKKIPKAKRGQLEDHIRAYLEREIPPGERKIVRGNEEVDAVEYILTDLGSYA